MVLHAFQRMQGLGHHLSHTNANDWHNAYEPASRFETFEAIGIHSPICPHLGVVVHSHHTFAYKKHY